MPSRTTLYQRVTQNMNANVRSSDTLYRALIWMLEAAEGVVIHSDSEHANSRTTTSGVLSILVTARENTWSRSARRKIMNVTTSRMSGSPLTSLSVKVMQCRITCEDGPCPSPTGSEKRATSRPHLVHQWVDGNDRGVYENFVSHVNRRVAAVVAPGT